ncbi:MAG: hypothetical protein NTX86_00200 [Candidatus Dependentiae bacterium]|nr:hypothetical protein [Candidatus Dependentiae bacterium]
MNRRSTIVISSFILLFNYQSHGVVVGSETAVSIQPAYTFPSADFDNTMLGFAWFKNGFTLEDSLTTCTFDAVYPVSGDVNLNGGTLFLNQDLLFRNITTLSGLGTIIGNNHLIDFCSSITGFPTNTQTMCDAIIFINGDITVDSAITFQGNCRLFGDGHSIKLGESGALVVDSGSTLEISNAFVSDVSGNNVRCFDDSASIILDDVIFDQHASFTFESGSLKFVNSVTMLGTGTFFYESSQTSTIEEDSRLIISEGMHFWLGRKELNGVEPLAFSEHNSALKLESCSLIVTSSGLNFTKGQLEIGHDVVLDIHSSTTTYGLTLGSGAADDDFTFKFSSAATVLFKSGCIIYANSRPDLLVSDSPTVHLIRSQASRMYMARSVVIPSMVVQLLTALTPSIEVASPYTVSYDNVVVMFPGGQFTIVCDRYDQTTFYLDGDGDNIFLTKGTFPLKLVVSGLNNYVLGNGNLAGLVTLQDSSTNLSMNMVGLILSSVAMNGGKITLAGNLSLGNSVLLTGTGTVDLTSYELTLGSRDMTWTSTIAWQGTNGAIDLHGKLSLMSTWTINGDVSVHGNGNILEFGSTGQIVVADGAHLTFKDIWLTTMSSSNLVCLGDASCITLDDVTWIQDSDFTFSTGSMKIVNTVDMSGPYTFMYDSAQTSTITQKSELYINNGLTLLVGKKSDDALVEPFEFIDLSSVLKIENGGLHINSHGISFTKGTVACVRDVDIDINSTSTANGMTLGDGTAENDMVFEFYPGAAVLFSGGHLTYDITSGQGIKSHSNSINMIRSDESYFWLKQNLLLKDLTIHTGQLALLVVEDGKTLSYSNLTTILDQGTFDLTAIRYNEYMSLLAGGMSIYMTKGVLPLYTLVASTGNTIRGNGNVGGMVIWQDSSAGLYWDVSGAMLNNMLMNGGTLTLNSDIVFSSGMQILDYGTVKLGSYNFKMGTGELTYAAPLYWDGTDGVITLNSNVTLSSTWTFSGSCILDGRGYVLDLSDGTIVVEEGSTLHIRNTVLKNIAGTNISCLDNAGSIVLDGTTWIQNGDYTFTTGSMKWENIVRMKGAKNFAYQTTQTSTVMDYATLILDQGVTFSYDTSANNLLAFADATSRLALNSATLYAAGSGLQLTKGLITIDGNCNLNSDASDAFGNPGITLGNGTGSDDCTCIVSRGSQLQCAQGYLNYNNVNASSLQMANGSSEIVINDGATLRLYTSLPSDPGTVQFGAGILGLASGAEVQGTMNVSISIEYVTL